MHERSQFHNARRTVAHRQLDAIDTRRPIAICRQITDRHLPNLPLQQVRLEPQRGIEIERPLLVVRREAQCLEEPGYRQGELATPLQPRIDITRRITHKRAEGHHQPGT